LDAQRLDGTAIVYDALAALWPGRFGPDPLPEDASLGEGGLGLDSIELVELLLECAERAGRPASEDLDLLDAGPITLGQLIDHLNRA
jgi:hypothetical protein